MKKKILVISASVIVLITALVINKNIFANRISLSPSLLKSAIIGEVGCDEIPFMVSR